MVVVTAFGSSPERGGAGSTYFIVVRSATQLVAYSMPQDYTARRGCREGEWRYEESNETANVTEPHKYRSSPTTRAHASSREQNLPFFLLMTIPTYAYNPKIMILERR